MTDADTGAGPVAEGGASPSAGEAVPVTGEVSPFTDEVVGRITRHMNDDHAADCLAICRALGGVPDATAARMTGMTAEAFAFAATVGGVDTPVRVPFGRRLTERAEVRVEAVRMAEEARARLGLEPPAAH